MLFDKQESLGHVLRFENEVRRLREENCARTFELDEFYLIESEKDIQIQCFPSVTSKVALLTFAICNKKDQGFKQF